MDRVLKEFELLEIEKVEIATKQEIIRGVFENEKAMLAYLQNEERSKVIKFLKRPPRPSESSGQRIHTIILENGEEVAFKESIKYYCSLNGKAPENPVRESKKIVCHCKILLRKYEGTEKIFFEYDPNHSHDIGPLNAQKLRLSAEIKQEVLFCFQQGWSFIAVRENLKLRNDFNRRDSLITDREIRRIENEYEKTKYALNENDVLSTIEWAKRLEDTKQFLYFDPKPSSFELAFVTNIGRSVIKKCNKLICLDSTHQTTAYNYSLFSIVTQNEYGHGVPVAHLICRNSKTETIKKFLLAFKEICPTVGTIMTDNDDAEINAIKAVYPESFHLLFWWHVEKAWKMKLSQREFQSVDRSFLDHMKRFLHSPNDFDSEYAKIVSIAHPSFITIYPKKKCCGV